LIFFATESSLGGPTKSMYYIMLLAADNLIW